MTKPTDDLVRKRSATERLIIAKTLLESILQDMPAAEIGDLIRCRDCKHFHENVWGDEIGLDDLPIIVGHEACDAWGREWTQSFADGYCHMAERRSDE